MRFFFPHKKHVSLQIILREVDEIAKQNRKNKKHVEKKNSPTPFSSCYSCILDTMVNEGGGVDIIFWLGRRKKMPFYKNGSSNTVERESERQRI